MLADRQRLRQVLLNLLSNAVKYNRRGGRVTLDGGPSPDGKRVRLSVADTGLGIAPENLPLLFTPFERLGAENTDVEGSGIGLALSKRLVESQRGELGVESEPGAGSTFWVDLPVAAAPLAARTRAAGGAFRDVLFPAGKRGRRVIRPGVGRSPPRARCCTSRTTNPTGGWWRCSILQRPALRLLTASRGQRGLDAGAGAPPGSDPAGHAPARHDGRERVARVCAATTARGTRRW